MYERSRSIAVRLVIYTSLGNDICSCFPPWHVPAFDTKYLIRLPPPIMTMILTSHSHVKLQPLPTIMIRTSHTYVNNILTTTDHQLIIQQPNCVHRLLAISIIKP